NGVDGYLHTSGHAYKDEHIKIFNLTRPKYFMPYHGEYRMSVVHGYTASECGVAPENVVVAKIAKKCEIQLSYAIGLPRPQSIYVDTFGTSEYNEETIQKLVNDLFDLSVAAIIKKLDLRRPIYLQTATFGHFGRNDLELPWEKLDMVDKINKYIKELKK
ncbi:methionine adenosyltransferase domain-containing protein, partial [Metamycoplasma equirhinis]|uniref:methionine adenosyltransferase domain-containing protein n=1 Tax=Metamycoplasma equirhinis TaxID=92402 RepID=UPI0035932D1C